MNNLKVVYRLPQDLGKSVYLGGSQRFILLPTECEHCNNPATAVVKGEADSFGWEACFFCDEHLEKMNDSQTVFLSAVDIKDRAGDFYVAETTNYDSLYSWERNFSSFREAVAFWRFMEQTAAPYGGLYPGNGVRERK